MSASLVGSEMCIRDRYPLWGIPAAGVHLRATGDPEGLPSLGARRLPWLCLLYTSDAADDM
eukprot:8327179-Alexandrium_andersonii.AAC.1